MFFRCRSLSLLGVFIFLAAPSLPALDKPVRPKATVPANWDLVRTSPASQVRGRGKNSYIPRAQLSRPAPASSAGQLAAVNPALPQVLRDYGKLLSRPVISNHFTRLYDAKLATLNRGDSLNSHNYFDCETVLHLRHPVSGRAVIWVQADMDVVTDGSDPGRASRLADYTTERTSDWYLPETAYSWGNATGKENPFLRYYPRALNRLQHVRSQIVKEAQSDSGVVWRDLLKACDAQIYRVKARGLGKSTRQGLSSRRFLLSEVDPFMVLPRTWFGGSGLFAPKMGDYALVIYGNRILPCIVGDAGPADKVGEASLRLAKAVNSASSGKTRAVNDLTVSYLVFPGTASARSTPNVKKWEQVCRQLLAEIGGAGGSARWHSWK